MANNTSVEDAADNLAKFNNFLTIQGADSVNACVMLLMMVANRINLVNLALQQSRNLLKMLLAIQRPAPGANVPRMLKEMLSLADTLATTLTAKRYFIDQASPGNYEMDPRFLLFEYAHGFLLRNAQVQLVRKLISEIEAGRSICHQVQ